MIWIGCAGWSVPASSANQFPTGGSHLERYATHFDAVEINSSFYRPHRPATYQRWAAAVPMTFRFAVKMPRLITHERRLVNVSEPLQDFLQNIMLLGSRLGPVLVQLPPSLVFHPEQATTFLATLRMHFSGPVVCEPRHASWFTTGSEELLIQYQIARVGADPAATPNAAVPGGWDQWIYYRLHGSPRTYYSSYPPEYLRVLAAQLLAGARQAHVWCIFDNTALGAATLNALMLRELTSSMS